MDEATITELKGLIAELRKNLEVDPCFGAKEILDRAAALLEPPKRDVGREMAEKMVTPVHDGCVQIENPQSGLCWRLRGDFSASDYVPLVRDAIAAAINAALAEAAPKAKAAGAAEEREACAKIAEDERAFNTLTRIRDRSSQ